MIIYRFWFLVCSDSARDTQWKRDRDSERFLCKRIRHFTMSVQRMCTLLERANGAFWLILKTLALSRGSHTHDVLQCLAIPPRQLKMTLRRCGAVRYFTVCTLACYHIEGLEYAASVWQGFYGEDAWDSCSKGSNSYIFIDILSEFVYVKY